MRGRFVFHAAVAVLLGGLALAGVWMSSSGRRAAPIPREDQHPVAGPLGQTSAAMTDAGDADQASPPEREPAWFSTITASTGISFEHVSGDCDEKPYPAANGSGLAALDYDRDGWFDLYFATGTPFPIDPDRTSPTNGCWRNLGANRFAEVTNVSGLGHAGYTAGIAVGDYDGDGFPDLFLNCLGECVLYHNLGDGRFESVGRAAGVAGPRWGTSAAFFDHDHDGLSDLYVCVYGKWRWEDRRWCGDRVRNVRIHCSPHSIEAAPDVLFRNAGDGTFVDATRSAKLAGPAGRAQGVIAGDFNADGACDLYVGNDLNANSLFLNDGSGQFVDASERAGVAYDFRGAMQAGMGVDAADINGDGFPELFVTNFANEHNAFYVSSAAGIFQEASQQWGLYAAGLPWVGWGTAFADFDLDGRQDLVVVNGHVDNNRHLLGEDAPHAQPALLWRGSGARFDLVGSAAGEYFRQPRVGRGLVVADLDNDGDQDLAVGHQDAPPAILRNDWRERAPRVVVYGVRLVGTRSNRDAVGATLTFRWNGQSQVQHLTSGGSYLSSHGPRTMLALPVAAARPRLEVQWPGGGVSVVDELQPDMTAWLMEPPTPSPSNAVVYQRLGGSPNPP